MVNLLGSRSLASVRKALLHFIGRCKAEGFEVRVLRSDGEGAVIKMTDELQNMGILVNPAAAGSHVPSVERKIGVVKGRLRGHINTEIGEYCADESSCALFRVEKVEPSPPCRM